MTPLASRGEVEFCEEQSIEHCCSSDITGMMHTVKTMTRNFTQENRGNTYNSGNYASVSLERGILTDLTNRPDSQHVSFCKSPSESQGFFKEASWHARKNRVERLNSKRRVLGEARSRETTETSAPQLRNKLFIAPPCNLIESFNETTVAHRDINTGEQSRIARKERLQILRHRREERSYADTQGTGLRTSSESLSTMHMDHVAAINNQSEQYRMARRKRKMCLEVSRTKGNSNTLITGSRTARNKSGKSSGINHLFMLDYESNKPGSVHGVHGEFDQGVITATNPNKNSGLDPLASCKETSRQNIVELQENNFSNETIDKVCTSSKRQITAVQVATQCSRPTCKNSEIVAVRKGTVGSNGIGQRDTMTSTKGKSRARSSAKANGKRKKSRTSCATRERTGPVGSSRSRRLRIPKEGAHKKKNIDYWHMGDVSHECEYCHALFWHDERNQRKGSSEHPKYSICCRGGQVEIPHLQDAPKVLYDLVFGDDTHSKHFKENFRSYNSMFQFTSMGAKINRAVNSTRGPPTFILNGENYHLMGSLLPQEGTNAKFAQLYVFDTQNEIKNRLSAVRGELNKGIDEDIVRDLRKMLDENNVLVKAFRMVRESLFKDANSDVKLRLIGKRRKDGRRYNLPSANEVAALIVGDFDINRTDRDIVVETCSGKLKRINQLNPAYLALQYPLLFPYGEDGYREDICLNKNVVDGSKARKELSMKEFFAFRIQERLADGSPLLYARRLFQQFLVDGYSMIESARLNYIRLDQERFRVELYKGIKDAVLSGETTPSSRGKRIILPSSFTGGPRYMIQNYQDAIAICRVVGYPDLFITFTCNPKWPELEDFLKNRDLNADDRPDMVCRAFKVKLDHLIKDIREKRIFGKVSAVVYTIEFQKRGLPDAHILLFLHRDDKYPTGEDIDSIISAEIPDKDIDPEYHEAVEKHMMHGPCGLARKDSPCMENGKCIRHFPKRFVDETTVDEDGYPVYRRRDNGRTINKNGIELDNRYVVPHNRLLLMRYGAHINVEWCNQSRSIKYLFKYVNKGNDRVTASFYKDATNDPMDDNYDEVSMYYDCRYISPCEAAWRIFGYNIHYREPSVVRLGFHLPNEQSVVFKDYERLDDVMKEASVKESMFLGWFDANIKYTKARTLTYADIPTRFVWNRKERLWEPRKTRAVIGRIYFVPPGSGENYYLRLLLTFVRGPTCYEDIRTVDGVVYPTFKDACNARGLLDDDKEYIDAIEETSHWASGSYLRKLFATLLFSNSMERPEKVWENTWNLICDDIIMLQRRVQENPGLQLTHEEIKDFGLMYTEEILNSYNRSLKDFPLMPRPSEKSALLSANGLNKLILDELRYDKQKLSEDHSMYMTQLTGEQNKVYNEIMEAVESGNGGVFFLYGYGGTGKTFVWKTLAAALRSKGEIVLTVASSGIASLLLPGGRTAHSHFAIPIELDEYSTCNIRQGTPLAELLIKTKLIIWDEAPMVNRFCIEALDRTMQDLLRFKNSLSQEQPFGGKTIVFGGDFRQILPVIPKGSRQDIVNATLNSSHIWNSCKILSLTKNMRLQGDGTNEVSQDTRDFAEWILKVGDGCAGESNGIVDKIDIPDDILVHEWDDPIEAICRSTYPELFEGTTDGNNMEDRSILTPTLQIVEEINNYMMGLNKSEARTYYSSDKACPTESTNDILASVHTPEFLNTLKCSGVPNHELTLKVGTPIMLLRNIDHKAGLCNGTRLIVTRLGKFVIEARTIAGKNSRERVFIPRMTLTPSDHRIPFKFQRRQFPIMVSYAMSINKSQGQSLSRVGLLLKKPVFTHGQLYVALSRVTNRKGLKILICHGERKSKGTDNVVFKEVFRNLAQ